MQTLTRAAAVLWLAGLLTGTPASGEDAGARALEAEIERARLEEEMEAAALRDAAETTARGEAHAAAPPTWDEDLEQARLQDRTVGAAWRAAWQELIADQAFREAACFGSAEELAAAAGDRIRHRALARDDFRARERSRDVRQAVVVHDAVTVAHVSTAIVCLGRLRAEEVVRGRFAIWFEDLEYLALLDRAGSWWNPTAPGHPEWVLRHEQLHFDITELVARRRNAERVRDAAATKVVADSPGAAARAFAARWSEHFGAIVADWMALQDRYDRETRHGTVPKPQTAWFGRVHRELATLSASAR